MMKPIVDEYMCSISAEKHHEGSNELTENLQSSYEHTREDRLDRSIEERLKQIPRMDPCEAYMSQKLFGSTHLSYISNGPVIKLVDSSNVLSPVQDQLRIRYSPVTKYGYLPLLAKSKLELDMPFNYHY